MQASMFNVRVPLDDRNDVFLMNTFTDAQLLERLTLGFGRRFEPLDAIQQIDDVAADDQLRVCKRVHQEHVVSTVKGNPNVEH